MAGLLAVWFSRWFSTEISGARALVAVHILAAVVGADVLRGRVLEFYDEAIIAGGLRWTGTDNVPGGIAATLTLAERAARHGFTTGGFVIDIGNSTGGPGRAGSRRGDSEQP